MESGGPSGNLNRPSGLESAGASATGGPPGDGAATAPTATRGRDQAPQFSAECGNLFIVPHVLIPCYGAAGKALAIVNMEAAGR